MSRTPRLGLRRAVAAAAVVPLTLTLAMGAAAAPLDPPVVEQPELEARVKEIITVDDLQFRDLNDNGELDAYEDWREPTQDRIADLVGQMTLEEKAGLMLIDTLNASCIDGDRASVPENGYDFVENQFMHRFIFRNTVAGPDDAVCGEETGGFRASTVVTPAEAAEFTNAVQELTEATRLGIPSLFKSNARNHIDPNARAGINESAGAFSAFPKEAGIASAALGAESLTTGQDPTTGDMSVVEDFANVMGEEWASIGLRGMYGYMADLSTEPRWYRTHETFTEDAYHAAAIMETLVETLQGPLGENGLALSPQTRVALTLKHFPGGGPQELGLDPHYAFGKGQVYPTGLFAEHFLPFEAAIDAGVSSIMPYYGVPVAVPEVGNEDENYPHTGFAFSDSIVNGLLRDQLGFTGYVNSDTGIINDRAWGLESATVPQRVAAAINAGNETLSGFNQVSVITELVDGGLLSVERIDEAAERLLEPFFRMGLFENPYVDPDVATTTIGSDENRAVGVDLQRESLVLLQNEETDDGPVLPLEDGSDVYILGDFTEETVAARGYDVTNGNPELGEDGEEDEDWVRPSAEDSDYVLISMTAFSSGPDYVSNSAESGLDPDHGVNPSVIEGIPAYDGESLWGGADACVLTDGALPCTDSTLRFGGAYPWESDVLDFTGMQAAESWEVIPSLDTIQQVMSEVDDPSKVVLHVYFRQPYVLDVDSGLRDAGAIVAGFGMTDTALLDVLSGDYAPQGKMPFALAGTPEAIIQQASDAPGYDDTDDGALYPFGFGLTYQDEEPTPPGSTLNAIPTIEGPVTGGTDMWSSMERARVPFDVADYGFVEEEYFLSGTANVYDGGFGEAVVAEEDAPYVNNILVRRPADAADSSGVVLVDILNASNGFPGEDHWRRMWQWALEEGHTVIGLTSKPIQVDALHNYEPERYEDLTWDVDPSIDRDPILADPNDPSSFNPHMVVEGAEEGLAWDIITQLGALLASDEAGTILGGQTPQTTLLMGQSQSGVYLNTYTTNFHEAQAEANGASVWDGYLNSVGAVLERPLQQDTEDGLDMRPGSEPGFDVPYITVTSEGDGGLFGMSTLAEKALPENRYHWQVPGTPHTDLLSPVIPADEEIYRAGRLPNTQVHDEDFREALNIYPLEPAIIAAAQALIDADQDGASPAASQWITQGNSFVRDEAGNATGGVRYGLIEYPLGQYLGAAEDGAVYGSMNLISAEEFVQRYGSRAEYLDLIATFDADQVEAGYLTAFGAHYFQDVAAEMLDRIGVPDDDGTTDPTDDGSDDAAAPGGSLPSTGAEISSWVALAVVALLALGGALVAIRRRAMKNTG